jgi:protein-tyrosine phosphatase
LRARQFQVEDFERFDRILAMDSQNLHDILRLARGEADRRRVRLMLDYPGSHNLTDVPDPYFGGDDGFHHVFSLLDDACTQLLEEIRLEARL